MGNSLAVDIVAKTDGLSAGLAQAQAQVASFSATVNTASDAQTAAAGERSLATAAQSTAQAWVASRQAMIAAEERATTLLKAGRKADVSSLSNALDEMDARRDAFMASSAAYYGSLDAMQQASWAAQNTAANKEIEADYQRLAGRLADATAVDADTAATDGNTVALTLNASAMREAGYAASELATGRYGRLETSLLSLSNRVGLMSLLFSPMGAAIGVGAAAVGGFTFAVIEGERESDAFNRAILSTGDAAALTEGQFNAMAQTIAGGNTTIGTARDALTQLAQSGRFTGASLQEAAQGAIDFAEITGESMKEATAAVEELATKPAEAIARLNAQYHFLTAAQFENIQSLEQEGDATGAATAAVQAFAAAMHERAQQSVADEGLIVRGWESVKGAISGAWDELKGFGRDTTVDDQIAKLKEELSYIQSQSGVVGDNATNQAMAAQIQAQLRVLEVQKQQQAAAAQQKAEQDQINEAGIAAAQALQRQVAGLKTQNTVLQHQLEITKEIEALHRANPDSALLKGDVFNAQGILTQGNAIYEQLMASIQKKFASHPTPLVMPISFSTAGIESEISQDSQYLQQAATQQREMDQENAAAYRQVMQLRVQAAESAMNTEVGAGQMSASQRLAVEQQLTQAMYAQDLTQLQNEESTLTQGTAAYQRAFDQIVLLKAQEVAALAALDQKYLKGTEPTTSQLAKQWQNITNEIESAESGMVSDLLTKRRSLSQDLMQIGSQLVSTEISNDLKAVTTRIMLSNQADAAQKASQQGGLLYYLATELQKTMAHTTSETTQTAATIAGNSTRTAATQAAAASSHATAAATGAQTVMADAAKAFSGTYAAVVQIPYVGWILAPAAAAGAFAAVAAYQGLASLDVGAWSIPQDMPAMLHAGEMVVPAQYAGEARKSGFLGGDGGDSGGGGTSIIHNGDIHIHDTDVAAMLDSPAARNAVIGTIAKAIARGHRP